MIVIGILCYGSEGFNNVAIFVHVAILLLVSNKSAISFIAVIYACPLAKVIFYSPFPFSPTGGFP